MPLHMQIIIWHYYQRESESVIKRMLNQCQPLVKWQDFESSLYVINQIPFDEYSVVPSEVEYLGMGLMRPGSTKESANSYPRKLVSQVSSAGVVAFVAMTGWRRGEYGFSLNRVNIIQNRDKLDGYAFPNRYLINWVVPKTHGNSEVDREISFYSYSILYRINQIHGSASESPCLFKTKGSVKKYMDSGQCIRRALCDPWESFVRNYRGFKDLDALDNWKIISAKIENSKECLSEEDSTIYSNLLRLRSSDEWDNYQIDPNLIEARARARSELTAVLFSSYGRNDRRKKDWLKKYRDGELREDWTKLLDEKLPGNAKEWISGLSDKECVVPSVAKKVNSYILSGVSYPNPHALRHI
ncbi:hypothetical protein [Zhongshania marina]|uniref:Uncharacterized protein n=1 Tax=Zhongshania marina TaxID=2304603 RepID=A0A2S4HE86_9GAMM|nr:hypothetical protein [Marortus luteolus]POP52295.1 hypothetical protein C0068_13035 [Marortus luteolus]